MEFEIEKKDCNGRTGNMKMGDKYIHTPNILFIATSRFPAFEFADILISDGKIEADKPLLVNRGSIFTQAMHLLPDVQAPAISNDYLSESLSERRWEIFDALCVFRGRKLFEKPKEFAKTIVEMKRSIPVQMPVYAQGLGEPSSLALLSYCGIDLFDSSSLIEAARAGYYLFADGRIHKDDIRDKPCACPECSRLGHDFENILRHNYFSALCELRRIQNAISSGSLRELIEQRIRSKPEMVAVLRHLDYRYYEWQEENFPVAVRRQILATSKESLYRPDVERFRRRIIERYRKPESPKILLLLPCSAKKPYSLSKSHQAFREIIYSCGKAGAVHEVIVTSPLGIVPREIETFYPAQNYDVPVTGDWDEDEKKLIKDMLAGFLSKNRYERIICHLNPRMRFIDDALNAGIPVSWTAGKDETSEESLAALSKALKQEAEGIEHIPYPRRAAEDIRSFARFQFGTDIFEGCRVIGRFPSLKIFENKIQLGTLVGERGMISMTIEGGKALLERGGGAYAVEIEDFEPEGNIFAVGVVGADEKIRIGDEVVVAHKGDVRAVGIAMMSGKEMKESESGMAVKVRRKVERIDREQKIKDLAKA